MRILAIVLLLLILPSTVLAAGVPKGRDQKLANIFALDLAATQRFYECNTKQLCRATVIEFSTYDLAYLRRVGVLMKGKTISTNPCNMQGLKLANTTVLAQQITAYAKGKLGKNVLLKTQTKWLLQAIRVFKVC